MIALGGNIYFLAKIGATDGRSFQQMAGSMTGMTEEEYREMMVVRWPLPRGQPVHPRVGRRVGARGGRSLMARITGSVYTSHVPAIGAALDHGRDRRALLATGLRRVRGVQGVDRRAHARRRRARLQRPRDGVQPRAHPDLRDRHGGDVFEIADEGWGPRPVPDPCWATRSWRRTSPSRSSSRTSTSRSSTELRSTTASRCPCPCCSANPTRGRAPSSRCRGQRRPVPGPLRSALPRARQGHPAGGRDTSTRTSTSRCGAPAG